MMPYQHSMVEVTCVSDMRRESKKNNILASQA